MEIHQSAVTLLLVLSASFTSQESPYEKFVRQHVGPDMNEHKCDTEIRDKEIHYPGPEKHCKKKNTFIQADEAHIKTVCGTGGKKQSGNLYKSSTPFPVITCELLNPDKHPNCKYKGKKSTPYIILACNGGLPVHYEKEDEAE
ncbi:ribonuclease-like 3 [Onychostoma macrolepis]|uniref:ribonuclease-like 3 n=1 Tax=Onychostoma macrolepis TaxID=369639 RepID=UPI00272B4FEE|nr:ribonuclease-like 3 [Onychostoma macrolepis]